MNYFNLIPWGISFMSLLVAGLTFLKNGKKQSKEDVQKEEARFDGINQGLLKANMKLDQVCATTNETRSDIKSLNKDLSNLDRRLTILERDVKTAFNDIEELKGKVGD